MAYMTDGFRIKELEAKVARLERVMQQLAHVLKAFDGDSDPHTGSIAAAWTYQQAVDKAIQPLQEPVVFGHG